MRRGPVPLTVSSFHQPFRRDRSDRVAVVGFTSNGAGEQSDGAQEPLSALGGERGAPGRSTSRSAWQ